MACLTKIEVKLHGKEIYKIFELKQRLQLALITLSKGWGDKDESDRKIMTDKNGQKVYLNKIVFEQKVFKQKMVSYNLGKQIIWVCGNSRPAKPVMSTL